jgi:hypothetical protein
VRTSPAANDVEQSIAMNDFSNSIAGLDQTDEDILTHTVSDEALEAAAGTEGGPISHYSVPPGLHCC